MIAVFCSECVHTKWGFNKPKARLDEEIANGQHDSDGHELHNVVFLGDKGWEHRVHSNKPE